MFILAATLISTQGVEAKPPKNKQPRTDLQQGNKGKNKGRVQRDIRHGNPHDPRRNGQEFQQLKFRHGGQRYNIGTLLFYEGRVFRMSKGFFYKRGRYGRWIEVNAPVGLRVPRIPRRARVVHSRRGILYEAKGTFYRPARRGGYVIVNAPIRFRNQYEY